MEDSTPLHLCFPRSFSDCEISSLKSVKGELCDVAPNVRKVVRFLLKRAYNDLESKEAASGSYFGAGRIAEVLKPKPERPQNELPHETRRKARYGLWPRRLSRFDVAKSMPEQPQNELPHETRRWRQTECWLEHCNVVKSKPEQPQDELPHGILGRVTRLIKRKQDELPHETQRCGPRARYDCWEAPLKHVDVVSSKPEQDERPHEPSIHVRLCISASNIVGTHGIGRTVIGSYVSVPVKQQSERNKNYSQSQPISGNRKAEDLRRGNQGEDKDPNKRVTVITIRDEDQESDHNYNSSFASAQFLTLAISSLLLCLIVLFPNFAEKNQAITAAALMGATLASLVSLETIPKWPNLARTCGYLAILSLLVGLASLLSSSLNWVTI